MKLGLYEFEWEPDEMEIPRPNKAVAVQENLGGTGFLSWTPQLIGNEIKLKWKFTSVEQYEEFNTMFLAGGTHILDLNPKQLWIDGGEGGPQFAWPDPIPYPATGYEGVAGGPTYRRFYIGPIHHPPWPLINSSEMTYHRGVTHDWYHAQNRSTSYPVDGVTRVAVGQTWRAPSTQKLWYAYMYLGVISQTFLLNSTVVAKIYAHSGTYGSSGIPTGEPLATSEVVSMDTFYWEQFYPFEFTGADAIILTSGTDYVLTVEYTGAAPDTTHGLKVFVDATSPTHGGNFVSKLGSTWTPEAGIDAPFCIVTGDGIRFIPGEAVTFSNGAHGTHINDGSDMSWYEIWNGVAYVPGYWEGNIVLIPPEHLPLPTLTTMTGTESGATAVTQYTTYNDHDYVYMNWNVPWDDRDAGWPTLDEGKPITINTDDPLNSYIEVDEHSVGAGLPEWYSGCAIYDNMGFAWFIIVPWDAAVRKYHLYPNPPLTTTKIYYDRTQAELDVGGWYPEVEGGGSFPWEVDAVNPSCMESSSSGVNDMSVVTHCGEDENGLWIRIRPFDETYEQVVVCAGEYVDVWDTLYGSGSIFIVPWGP